tara:strand:+ start:252 stop:449 length:198 start_codon:yes stop_codon:yes gene_type:complete
MANKVKSSMPARRKNKPKRRTVNERREDMLIISSATQGDIYTWAVSLAVMAGVLGVIITLAIVKG